ncbi:MAG: germination protein YpeB [Clostridia bacterium]|nr:germination protein YpeB [Clostridia bacterium]
MKKWIVYIALAVLVLSLLLSLMVQYRRAAAAEHTIHETTLAALSEASEELQVLTSSMEKLLIASSGHSALLTDMALSAENARHALASLPLSQEEAAPVLQYLADVSARTTAHLAQGTDVSADGLPALEEALSGLRLLHAELDLARASLLTGASLAEALPSTALTNAPTAAELVSYKALPSQEIGSGAAMQIAKEFVGEDRVVQVYPAPNTSGALPAFGVTVQTADVQLNVEVTQRGGKVLLMVPETASFPTLRTVDDCRQAALDFLTSRGFASMEAVYHQVYDGLCVLTLAHVQNGVLIWPDRVMVQVRMDTAEVVGIEARNYWKNHAPRKLSAPALSAEEARSALSASVSEQSVRLCLLPVGQQEVLCYQFTVTWTDDTYLVYIDANTGRQVLLEKVMTLDNGSLAA